MFVGRRHALRHAPARNEQRDAGGGVHHPRFHGQRNGRSERRPPVDDGVFAQQDDLAAGRTARFGFLGRRLAAPVDARPGEMARHFLGLPHLDVAAFHQRVDDVVEQMLRHVGCRSDATGVQGHVVLLDARGGERAQGGVVLREAHGAHHRGQFRALRRAQQAVVQAHGGVGLEGTAHGADLHRHLDLAHEVAVRIGVPAGQRAVATVARGIGVGCGFDGAEVVAGGDGHGVDAVHDALVVGGGAVWIDQRQVVRQNDAVAHLGAGEALHGEVLLRNGNLGANQRTVGEIG